MNLNTFRALVDTHYPSLLPEAACNDNELLIHIRTCFTPEESNAAYAAVGHIIDDLGLRYICDQTLADPYLGIAKIIRQALREHGCSTEKTSNWERAVELATAHAANTYGLPSDQEFRSNTRVNCLASAISELRKLGYDIRLPTDGGIDLPELEKARLTQDIDDMAASLGLALAQSAAQTMANTYSNVTGRFKVGRNGQTVQVDAKPDRPLAYLYQLGLRYFELQPSAPFPQATLVQLVNLTTWSVALLDLTVNPFELMYARDTDMLRIMKKSVMYDSVFLLTQAKPIHAREYLEWMMSHEWLASLSDENGRTSAQIFAISMMLLRKCEQACLRNTPQDFIQIPVRHAAYATNLNDVPAEKMLRDVFAHSAGANQTLTFPPDDTKVDAAFRPLLIHNGMFIMQPAPMAARATVNAVLQWCRQCWQKMKKGSFDDKVIGPLFEDFVRDKLAQRGVCVLHGNYKAGPSEGECDAVIETEGEVLIFELKSKMLRRESRAGDDVAAMVDLAQAVARPQAQGLERHAVLREQGALTLTQGASAATITLGKREVLKISITRGDLGSLHDRPFLGLFLQTGCISEFLTIDPARQHELKQLNEWFRKLKAAAERAKEPVFNTPFPFSTSWSLSIFQLLLLLERTSDNESFARELQRTRRMITPLRDFYSEYEYALEMERYKEKITTRPHDTGRTD